MDYSSLDPDYLARLEDTVLIHTVSQYSSALGMLDDSNAESERVAESIRVHLDAVKQELERRGLDAAGWRR